MLAPKRYNRPSQLEDPWISLIDHGPAIPAGMIVYGENSYGGEHASTVLIANNGGNVFVRNKAKAGLCSAAAAQWGDGWKLVRRVQAGPTWHPATDQLRGTAAYGTFVNDPQAAATFSVAFATDDFDEFLFSTGDCKVPYLV